MGLDAVEILMSVEEAFDICLDDSDVEKILTPAQLIKAVEEKVAAVEPLVCLNQRAFNFLRVYLVRKMGFSRKEVRPAEELCLLIPARSRSSVLSELAADIGSGSPAPGLVRPSWVKWLVAGVALLIGFGVGWRYGADLENGFILGAFAAVPAAWIGAMITRLLRTEFPPELGTVGDLARWVRRHESTLGRTSRKAWSRAEIAERVRAIVIEHLNCEESYREDALFIEDLGLS